MCLRNLNNKYFNGKCMRKKPNETGKESFTSQLKELWGTCSKKGLLIVLALSLFSSALFLFIKEYLDTGCTIEKLYLYLRWDSCVIQFFVLLFFIWLIILNKKVFSPQNISNRGSRFKQSFDRIISQGHFIQFYWLVSSFILLFIFLSALMGTFDAFGMFPKDNNVNWNPISLTYLLLTDTSTISNILKTNTHVANAIAIFCIVISVLGTLLFTGLLVSVFSNILQRRVEDFQKGRLYYELSDHIVFIGYDELLPLLVKQCAEYEANKNKKIVVHTKMPSEQVREDIKTLITDDNLYRNIIFYNGRRDSVKDLKTLDLNNASEVFIIGNRKSDNHDELNLQCLNYICDIINGSSKRAETKSKTMVFLLIEDHTEYSKMRYIWKEEKSFNVILFNIYAIFAKALILGKNEYPQIEPPSTNYAGTNIIIFGMSKYGSSIGIEAINFFKHKKEKAIISFICNNAQTEMDMLRARFPELFSEINSIYNNFIDPPIIYKSCKPDNKTLSMEIEFIETNPFNAKLFKYLDERNMKKYIFLCSGNNTLDLNSALFMPHDILLKSNVYILQKHGEQFINKLDYLPSVYAFGSLNPTFNLYEKLINKSDDLTDKYDSYKETSTIYENQGNWNRALDYGLKLLEISKLLNGNNSDRYANDLIYVGFLFERITDYETASYYFLDAYKIKEKIFGYFSKEIADLEDILGWCYVYQSDYNNVDIAYYGQECFGKAIEIKEKIWGKESEKVEDIKELANSYYGLYYACESVQSGDWKIYYDKYIELCNRIKVKEKSQNINDVELSK